MLTLKPYNPVDSKNDPTFKPLAQAQQSIAPHELGFNKFENSSVRIDVDPHDLAVKYLENSVRKIKKEIKQINFFEEKSKELTSEKYSERHA